MKGSNTPHCQVWGFFRNWHSLSHEETFAWQLGELNSRPQVFKLVSYPWTKLPCNVPLERFELPTLGSEDRCSSAEL